MANVVRFFVDTEVRPQMLLEGKCAIYHRGIVLRIILKENHLRFIV